MDLKLVKMEAVLVGESGLIQMTLKLSEMLLAQIMPTVPN